MSENNFKSLYELDVNHKTQSKSGLKYLSWAFAWAEFKKVYPDATYDTDLYDGKPFLYDGSLGYMVSTKVTVGELTIPMHLPVLDGANKAQKAVDYKYKTKYAEKECKAASMFDINTAIMRCLTKNLAMFGLGLYIYACEDIPSVEVDSSKPSDNDMSWVNAIKEDPELELIILNQDNVKWVVENWSGLIANKWSALPSQLTEKLNNTFNRNSQ